MTALAAKTGKSSEEITKNLASIKNISDDLTANITKIEKVFEDISKSSGEVVENSKIQISTAENFIDIADDSSNAIMDIHTSVEIFSTSSEKINSISGENAQLGEEMKNSSSTLEKMLEKFKY